MNPLFGPYVKIVRFFYLLKNRGWRVEGTPVDGPAVYLVHHQNLAGPVCAEALLDAPVHMWSLHYFLTRRDCFAQYYGYTFTARFGWPRPAAWLAAGGLSLVIPPLMRSLRAIPVYRGARELLSTMEASADALLAGESLLICPDQAYDSDSPALGALYNGFFHLEKPYFKKTGRHLSFVPLYRSTARKTLYVGQPLAFTGETPFRRERDELTALLRERMNAMGRAAGDIQ